MEGKRHFLDPLGLSASNRAFDIGVGRRAAAADAAKETRVRLPIYGRISNLDLNQSKFNDTERLEVSNIAF